MSCNFYNWGEIYSYILGMNCVCFEKVVFFEGKVLPNSLPTFLCAVNLGRGSFSEKNRRGGWGDMYWQSNTQGEGLNCVFLFFMGVIFLAV